MVEYEEMTTEIEKVVEPEALELQWKATSPEEFKSILADARVKAKDLMEVVESQKLYTEIGGKKHIHLEAWQLLGKAYGLVPAVPDDPTELVNGGFRAKAVINDLRTGRFVSSAFSECGSRGDGIWIGRPDYAQSSMAQTRATSKAFRICLSWVAVLAGYSPTPYEEMPDETKEKPIEVITQGNKVIPEKDERETEPCPLHLGEYWTKRNSPNSRDADKTNWSHPWKPEWCNIGASIVLNECVQLALTIGYTPQGIEKWINEATDGRTLDGVRKTEMIEVLRKMRREVQG